MINYQKKLDDIINGIGDKTPTLLLHSCCAPCSSYVIEYLSRFFSITVYYYNPNITFAEEYAHRVAEQIRFLSEIPVKNKVCFLEGKYEPERFFSIAKGLEDIPEGGERCFKCYDLRLRQTAIVAKNNNFDYFTTTLSISPYKNAQKLNEIGEELSNEFGVNYLYSDFKKKNGYRRSVELSVEYGLYRQDYCGCVFSKKEADLRKKSTKNEFFT